VDGRTIHLLLIEDEEAHVELVRRTFESQAEPAGLTACGTLREARAAIAQSVPDLVIVDMRLPDGNGLDILPAEGEKPSFPVVVLTAHGDEHVAVEAMKRGALDYVVKSEAAFADAPHIARRALREWRHIVEQKRAEDALKEAHAELERRVQERTAELTAANRQLRDEISVRQAAEEALQAQNRLIDGILATLPVVAFRIDGDGVVEEMVGAGLANLGLKDRGLVGWSLPKAYPASREQVARALSGETVRFEARGRRHDKPFAFDTFMAFDEARGSGAVGFAIDITEHTLAQERAKKLRSQLVHIARVATMGEMASGIAHELNQPLGAIAMRAEVAARSIRLGKEPTQQHMLGLLDNIAEQTHRAGQILRRMRDFVKKTEPSRSTVDLGETIREVVALLESELQHAGIGLTCRVDQPLPNTLADKIQIQQVLLNLMRNAIEAMEHTEPDRRELHVQATARDGVLEVAVRDSGCGLPDDGAERLFGAFYSTKLEGMGMGLAISRSIIEAHGGHISAAPNADRGATFTLILPIAEEDLKHER